MPERLAHCNLTRSAGRSRQQQIRDVRAGDEQHESHRAEECVQDRRRSPNHDVLNRPRRHAPPVFDPGYVCSSRFAIALSSVVPC